MPNPQSVAIGGAPTVHAVKVVRDPFHMRWLCGRGTPKWLASWQAWGLFSSPCSCQVSQGIKGCMHVGSIQSGPKTSVDAALPPFSPWRRLFFKKKKAVFWFERLGLASLRRGRSVSIGHLSCHMSRASNQDANNPRLCALPPPLSCFGACTPSCKFPSQLIQPLPIHAVIDAEPATTRVRIRLFGAPLPESLLSLFLSPLHSATQLCWCPLLEPDTRISAFLAVTPSSFPQQPGRDVMHGSECLDEG